MGGRYYIAFSLKNPTKKNTPCAFPPVSCFIFIKKNACTVTPSPHRLFSTVLFLACLLVMLLRLCVRVGAQAFLRCLRCFLLLLILLFLVVSE